MDPFFGQDANYQAGAASDFHDNGNGSVTDRMTGLTWVQAPSPEPMNWEEALAFCEALNDFGGDDWRLPNVFEAMTLCNYQRFEPAPDPIFVFNGFTQAPRFWTSTSYIRDLREAFYINYDECHIDNRQKGVGADFVWPVRGGIVSDPPSGVPIPALPFECGDTDGVDGLTISDPIHILSHLFLGGPPPCTVQSPVLRTGLEKCYNNGQNDPTEVPCPGLGDRFGGQDGALKAGRERQFQDNMDGTVTDLATGLMWVKEPAPNGEADKKTWEAALAFCEASEFQGHTTWRMPNVTELATMINFGREGDNNQKVYATHFVVPPIENSAEGERLIFWTSTTTGNPLNPSFAFNITFHTGKIHNDELSNDKQNTHFVWPVRETINGQ
jgi:hypothetical protein